MRILFGLPSGGRRCLERHTPKSTLRQGGLPRFHNPNRLIRWGVYFLLRGRGAFLKRCLRELRADPAVSGFCTGSGAGDDNS
jgi:hypothetical protein